MIARIPLIKGAAFADTKLCFGSVYSKFICHKYVWG